MPETISLFARLTKIDPIQGLAYGTAAAEEPDKSGEIFDYESSKPHFEKWSQGIEKATDGKSFGNVREMHGPLAAGKLTSISFDDVHKRIEVVAKILEKSTLEKLTEGVLTGFSIGGSYAKRWPDEAAGSKLTRYTAIPSEVSVVDNPCIPSATFSCIKEDGSTELRKFHVKPETPAQADADPTPAPKVAKAATMPDPPKQSAFGVEDGLEQVFKTDDGKFFKTKAEARAHRDTLAKLAVDAASPAGQLATAIADLGATVAKAESAAAEAPAAATDASAAPRPSPDGSAQPAADKVADKVAEKPEDAAKTPEAADVGKAAPRHGDEDAKHLAAAHDALSNLGFGKCAGMSKSTRFSSGDASQLQKAHDCLTKAGAPCKGKDAEDAADGGADDMAEKAAPAELTKALDAATAKNEALEKAMTDAVGSIKELVARVQKLESQPVARPQDRAADPRFHVVNKGDEDAASAAAGLSELAKKDPVAIAKALIFLAHQNPNVAGLAP